MNLVAPPLFIITLLSRRANFLRNRPLTQKKRRRARRRVHIRHLALKSYFLGAFRERFAPPSRNGALADSAILAKVGFDFKNKTELESAPTPLSNLKTQLSHKRPPSQREEVSHLTLAPARPGVA